MCGLIELARLRNQLRMIIDMCRYVLCNMQSKIIITDCFDYLKSRSYQLDSVNGFKTQKITKEEKVMARHFLMLSS